MNEIKPVGRFLVIEEKIFIYVKAPMHFNARTKFQLSNSVYFLRYGVLV